MLTVDKSFERRDPGNSAHRRLGHVVSCSGSRATIATSHDHENPAENDLWTVGKLISIEAGSNRIVALVYSIHTKDGSWHENGDNLILVEVELLGEVRLSAFGRAKFSTGISSYPHAGALVHRIRSSDLAAVYAIENGNQAIIGKLSQDRGMDAAISIDKLLARHFAVVGTTGVGKSTAVSLLVRKAIEHRQDLRILILDPHNEYAAAFKDVAYIVNTGTLDLPFWLFRTDEFAEVLFRGSRWVQEEIELLRDLVTEAKRAFRGTVEGSTARWLSDRKTAVTADTPLPYRVADLLALIEQRLGKLEGREEKPHLKSLKNRIVSAINDPRFHFMFSSNTIHDTILETIGTIFRIPGDGKPMTVFQMAGIPSEVVNSVASVLCRMAFDIALWGNGSLKIMVLCEEAHRYVPADEKIGFFPTRQAIARIAKEGRKYGISLGIVTQRPGELDPTILSQCSTLFAMRLANEQDQEIIRSAIPDSSMSTLSFLSSMGNREAIAFGDAVTVPMRLRFDELSPDHLPNTATALAEDVERSNDAIDLRKVVMSMRQVNSDQKDMEAKTMPQAPDTLVTDETAESCVSSETSGKSTYIDREQTYAFDEDAKAADREELRQEALRRLEERRASRQRNSWPRNYEPFK